MMQGMAKEKPEGNETEGTSCENPVAGEEQVAAYIVGDLTEPARRAFIAHVAECMYCLEQIVLWRMAEELAEEKGEDQQAARTAQG
jgi:hypothetical protein